MVVYYWEGLLTVRFPREDSGHFHPNFQFNLDDTCFVCSDGGTSIVG